MKRIKKEKQRIKNAVRKIDIKSKLKCRNFEVYITLLKLLNLLAFTRNAIHTRVNVKSL